MFGGCRPQPWLGSSIEQVLVMIDAGTQYVITRTMGVKADATARRLPHGSSICAA
jgi:hypothetical protein